MNTDKNTALYEKMAAEQDKFRDWLKSQPPEEILNHAYEYTVQFLHRHQNILSDGILVGMI